MEHNLANAGNEEIVEVSLGYQENFEQKLKLDRVRSWRDIEGVMGQYTDLPYPAYLPHHWAEERRHHLNYTVCSKYVNILEMSSQCFYKGTMSGNPRKGRCEETWAGDSSLVFTTTTNSPQLAYSPEVISHHLFGGLEVHDYIYKMIHLM